MLAEEVKERIQSFYRQLLESRDLTPRYGQRQMIAEIAKTLSVLAGNEPAEPPICVVEAGTGTGKTLAYLLSVVPLAQMLGYKVILSTATVALQEQVVFKDIPEILEGSDLDFSYTLAKGRGRYVCLSKLDQLLQGNDSLQAMMDLYGEELEHPIDGDQSLYAEMLDALTSGDWQGDRDDWEKPVSDTNWRPLTVDRYQCTGPKCSHFRNCCFYRARNKLDRVDCIIVNHDLVLTDLAMGGGAILPEPDKCLYIFDEAHQLPLKSNNHFSSFTRIKANQEWLERSDNLLQQLVKEDFLQEDQRAQLLKLTTGIRESLSESWVVIEQMLGSLVSLGNYENKSQYVFQLGQIPDELKALATDLANRFSSLNSAFQGIAENMRQELDEIENPTRREFVEQCYPLLGRNINRAQGNLKLWLSYAAEDAAGQVPFARWISTTENETDRDIGLSSSPVLAADNLQKHLWQCCGGAVLTSATLSALGQFDMLKMRAGLPAHTRFFAIPSPFDFANSATFVVPRMHCDPSDQDKHTDTIVKALPNLLGPEPAALMLFSSRRQMQDVMQSLPNELRDLILCQDDFQKIQLLKYHRQRIDNGEGSIIFGLSSFAEGIDLMGKYCTHVLIAKIPFAVPNDPIEMTLSAWVERQGLNAFMTLAVPDAAFRLVQASGRLLRSETDKGQITLFDERIINRSYGKKILGSMPPYRQEIFERDVSREENI